MKPIPCTLLFIVVALPVSGAENAAAELEAVFRRTPDLDQGRQLYEVCAACHGDVGRGADDGSVPAVAGQHYRVIAKQLVDFRFDRRWDIRMEHFADRHRLRGPQEIADLAYFVSSLERPSQPRSSSPELLTRGAGIYFDRCESCHGPIGEGDDARMIPRLAGQNSDYLLRQFYDAADGRRPNMGGAHARLLSKLERDELVGVADYLSRLMPAPEKAGVKGDL
jgi:cytochrome c553